MALSNKLLPESDDTISDSLPPNFAQVNWTGLCDYLSSFNSVSGCMSVSSTWNAFISLDTVGVPVHMPFHEEWCFYKWSYSLSVFTILFKAFRTKVKCWHLYQKFPATSSHDTNKRLTKACS